MDGNLRAPCASTEDLTIREDDDDDDDEVDENCADDGDDDDEVVDDGDVRRVVEVKGCCSVRTGSSSKSPRPADPDGNGATTPTQSLFSLTSSPSVNCGSLAVTPVHQPRPQAFVEPRQDDQGVVGLAGVGNQ